MSATAAVAVCQAEARLRAKATLAEGDLATVAGRLARKPESTTYRRALSAAQGARLTIRQLLGEHRDSCPACALQTERSSR